MDDIGIPLEKAISSTSGFHVNIDGKLYFCMFADRGGNFLGRVISFEGMYRSVINVTMTLAVGIVVTVLILVIAITRFTNRKIIKGIDHINGDLAEISSGNFDARADVRNCDEFSELSDHINDMIASVLSGTDKISYVLNKAELQIGVYEYNENMKTVMFTEKLAKILSLEDSEIQELSEDCVLYKEYISEKIYDRVSGEENVYQIFGETEKYVKFEEFTVHNSTLGIVMDVTEDYIRRRQLEAERDVDSLTGLLNRNGLDRRLETMFKFPEKLGCGALVMIDADGLKQINDKLGHEAGDAYLKSIADALRSFGEKNCICARQGGDEFVMFLYNYGSNAEVEKQLQRLSDIQHNRSARLNEEKTVPIKFSFGASFIGGSGDFAALLKNADDKMYESKRMRKRAETR